MILVAHHGFFDWFCGALIIVTLLYGISILTRGLHLIYTHYGKRPLWQTIRQIVLVCGIVGLAAFALAGCASSENTNNAWGCGQIASEACGFDRP